MEKILLPNFLVDKNNQKYHVLIIIATIFMYKMTSICSQEFQNIAEHYWNQHTSVVNNI
jgi:hypothetical protein